MSLDQFLSNIYYGNNVLEWLTALLLILGAIIAGKALYWFFGNIIKKVTAKTKTNLDDLIIDLVEEPLVFALTLIGIWFAINNLVLSEGILNWVLGILKFVIILDVAWFVTRLLDAVYNEYLIPFASKSKTDLDDQLLPIVSKGTKIIIWSMAIIVALNNAGYDVTALIAGLGIGGLALAMAAKDTVANIFGGVTIFTDSPFKVGDRVKVGGYDGTIKEIGIRSTRLVTLEGRIVTMPNSTFADSPVENVTKEPSRKVVLNLGLTYDTKPEGMKKAMKLLEGIAKKNKHIKEDVKISFNAFGDSAMNVLFIYYIKKGDDILSTQTEINLEILKQFTKSKLDFAFPSQTIYTKKG